MTHQATAKADLQQAPVLAKMHYQSLPEDFLPSLGLDFLEKVYYPAALRSDKSITFLLSDKGSYVGFVTVACDSAESYRDLFKRCFAKMLFYGILAMLRDPSFLFRSFQILQATLVGKPDPIKAEIVFIAVDKNHRNQGHGKQLISLAMKYLAGLGVNACRTKTLAANSNVIRMYVNLGWQIRDHFRLIQRDYVTLVNLQLKLGAKHA